jgi:carboxymethylenebutenolidase
MDGPFTIEELHLIELWERHMRCEFSDRDAIATVATMSRENWVNHVPVLTGGRGPEEMLVRMDWMLPGVPPTGRRVEVPVVVVVQLHEDLIVWERIYWDQASVLVQLGLLEPSGLPVVGVETARKVLDPGLPSNELIRRAEAR